jgi:hypothetical protein
MPCLDPNRSPLRGRVLSGSQGRQGFTEVTARGSADLNKTSTNVNTWGREGFSLVTTRGKCPGRLAGFGKVFCRSHAKGKQRLRIASRGDQA